MSTLDNAITAKMEAGLTSGLEDNRLLGIPSRAKLINTVDSFITEKGSDLIQAINRANDGKLAAGLFYAQMMSQFGIAQTASGGSRNAWNDFNTGVKAGKLSENFTKRDLTSLLADGKLNTLVYLILATGEYGLHFAN